MLASIVDSFVPERSLIDKIVGFLWLTLRMIAGKLDEIVAQTGMVSNEWGTANEFLQMSFYLKA